MDKIIRAYELGYEQGRMVERNIACWWIEKIINKKLDV